VLRDGKHPIVKSDVVPTAFTRLVGCRYPIQQAAMGVASTADLVVAVAEAGALGMLGMPMTPAEEFSRTLEDVRNRTSAPFGVNFLVPFLDPGVVTIAATAARVVEFFYGDPDGDLVTRAHREGALACWQVGSVEEARAAAGAGCDLVVAQGTEAGGHIRGQTGLLPLLDGVLSSIEVPVIAAGGIGSARSVKAVIAAGASAARLGTRFLAAHEADVHPEYVDCLVASQEDDTVLTESFSVGWPDAPHRVLRSCLAAAGRLPDGSVGETETEEGRRYPIPRFAALPPSRSTSGNVRAMALYAGQSVAHVRGRSSAADIVDELVAEL